METREAIVTKMRQHRDGRDRVWLVTVLCPFCGKQHQHGGGAGDEPLLGFRVPHCLAGEGEYVLTAASASVRAGEAGDRHNGLD
jgi:hypothetical protein